MSSFNNPCGPFCTDQLHDHTLIHNHPESRSGRGANGPSTPSNNQRTVLEPRFPPTGRPSSPRHYSTTTSTSRNTTQPTDLFSEPSLPTYDQSEVTLPDLRPDDPYAYAHGIGWSPDALEHLQNLATSDDSIFASLADVDFSSPSTYPPLAPAAYLEQEHLPPQFQPASNNNNSTPAANLNTSFTSNATSHLTTSSAPSTSGLYFDSLESFGPDIEDQFLTAESSFASVDMPSTNRRIRTASITIDDASPHVGKRRRVSDSRRIKLQNPTTPTKIEGSFTQTDDAAADGQVTDDNAPFMIDLTESNNEIPDELIDLPPVPKEEDKRVKLSAFQCVICMDDVSTLTLTHCGHMYCAQCLHSSLHVEATKGKCPMCRQKIEMKPRDTYTSRTKGFWPLELKLMTSRRKGKRKAGSLS